MCGTNCRDDVGHAFVLDGYDKNGLYHVNWGWGGASDGYFDVNFMSPAHQGAGGSNGGYVAYQMVVSNLYPDKTGQSRYESKLRVRTELSYDDTDRLFAVDIINTGLGSFTGEVGFLSEIDGKVAGYRLFNVSELQFNYYASITCSFSDLSLTTTKVAGKKCYV